MEKIFTLFIIPILLFISCSEIDKETPSTLFGLPHVAIEMRESDFVNLQRNSLVNEYAAVTVEIGGVKKHGQIRRRGNSSRYFQKPSFNIDTDEGRRHYAAVNFDKSYCREIFASLIFQKHGFHVQKMEFVSLSINNVYQGLYISREPLDEHFFKRRNIEINSLYGIRNGEFTFKDGRNSAMGFQKIIPESSIDYNDLNILISALDENNHAKIEQLLHINSAANYSFISSAINNSDGITKNLHIYSSKKDNKFHIIPYDLDLTFGQTLEDSFALPHNIPAFRNGLLEKAEELFLQNSAIHDRNIHIKYVFEDVSLLNTLDSLKQEISLAYKNDPYLKGENLDRHITEIKEYISAIVVKLLLN